MRNLAVAVGAVLVLAGCGGGGGGSNEQLPAQSPPASPSASGMPLAEACERVPAIVRGADQNALPSETEYRTASDAVGTLAADTETSGRVALYKLQRAYSDASNEVSVGAQGSDLLEVRRLVLDSIDELNDACLAVGSDSLN